ncbi:MAG: polyprenyl synthetase family protein [Clostridia bacterium]|nr:polyprenyl synthetase family protein [Clostridia bacterium]
MDLKKELNIRVEEINRILDEYMPKTEGRQKTVIDAMNYSVSAGGKRLRPMLMYETYKLFGGDGEVVKPFMAAMEMIHTYSLVHDDLPAMDNDEYRRGKKTTHAVYGETMGILAGDALLNYAFETAASAFDILFEKRVANAMKVLSEKAGIYGMIGGQVVDIESEGKKADIDTVEFIHTLKCGALIEASMQIGAILAGVDADTEKKIASAGADIGFAFQIQDDILDVTSTTEILGKPVGSDDKNEKSTYVSLKGIDRAKEDVKMLSERALDIISSFENRNEFLEELIKMLIKREK